VLFSERAAVAGEPVRVQRGLRRQGEARHRGAPGPLVLHARLPRRCFPEQGQPRGQHNELEVSSPGGASIASPLISFVSGWIAY
jgi:hypothetical protein